MKLITFKIQKETYESFKDCLKRPRKNIKIVDVLRPTIDSFIIASKSNRALEFIEYIKAWR
jgi:hypothetical protein